MSTSEHLRRKLSTFDDIANTCPLLFRLHSCGLSRTFFDAERKVLLASRHAQKRKDSDEVSYDLKGLERKDPLLTLDNRDAVAEHVSTWAESKTGPSAIGLHICHLQCSLCVVGVEASKVQPTTLAQRSAG